MSTHPSVVRMREAVASIVQELATAEPGKDIGLLPINSFVCDLEDPALLASLPAPMPEAVQCARLWIDQTLDSTARFDVQTLQRFQEWTLWMEAAMDAVSGSSSVPALPEAWRNPSRQAFSVSSQVAELAQSVAREISTAEVGKDAGLLPVNSFLCEIEEVLSRADLPAVIEEAVRLAREWVDHILDTTAVFDAGTLALFSEWVVWIDAALEQNETAELSLTIPSAWKDVARSGTPVAEAEGGARAGNTLGALAGLVRQLSLELAFTEEGKDTGLLPINSFLTQMRELLPSAGFPNAVSEALVQASAWLDALFDTTAQFDTWTIARLSEWAAWMDTALERLGSSQPLPEWPAAWANRTKSGGEKSPVAPEGGGLVSEAPVPVSSVRSTPYVEDAPVAVSFGATHAGAYSKGEESAGFPAEPPLALPLEGDDRDLIVGFISESYEHLQNIEQGVLVLEENPTDSATLNSIFRAFHTFKGGAGCCNLTPIKDLAHELESVLDAARQHRLALTTEIINAILEGGDTLGKFVAQIADRLAGKDLSVPICIPTLPLIARAQRILRGESGPEILPIPAEPPNSVGARDADRPVAPSEPEAAPPSQSRPASGASASAGKPTGASAEVPPLPGGAPGARAAGASGGAAAPAAVNAGFVKVDTLKLDALIDLVGELVISESMVVQDPGLRSVDSRNLTRNLGQLHRITSELQRTAMSLRMVPIRATFQKMTRLVRDIAAKQQKQVHLVMSGEDTELDRNIVEEISDPLVHMIRNAVDHGVEKPEAREARGKTAMGSIFLRAFHQGGNIVIQIEDDGNGLNKDRLLAKAREKGLIKPTEVLSDKEIYDLIFAPGFSTAEVVSDISGRGVGMDVVRQNIEKLRGKVEIDTSPGAGTTFTIYLPLTLAIIDGMIVSVGPERYIIPTLSVRESFRPRPEMISSVHERGEMVNVRGRLSPLLRLYQYLEQQPKVTDPSEGIVVVVESGAQTRCLMVDELLGKQEVVIKTLGGALKKNNALAGGAVLGDGRVGLILNVDALVKLSAIPAGPVGSS